MRVWIPILALLLLMEGCGGLPKDLPLTEDEPVSSGESLRDFWAERPGDLSVGAETAEREPAGGGQFLVGGSAYAYERLSAAEQIWYRDMEKILGDMAENGKLSGEGIDRGLSERDIDPIFQSVMLDHPELFFVDGYSYNSYTEGERLIGLEFSGNYNTDRSTALRKQAEISSAAERILSGAPACADDYGKVKYVYETLIRGTDYDSKAPDNQNIYSVLVGGASVCQGYAKATQFLLNRMGVECTLVQGTVRGERHGWNLVRADGEYYYLDTTWGDASYKSAEDGSVAAACDINYDYFCVTTRELLQTHVVDGAMKMPLCTALEDNYYVREGAYFTEPDEARLRMLFERANESRSYFVTLKCESRECYGAILRRLVEEGGVFELFSDEGRKVGYIRNEDQLSMTFWMTNE